MFISHLCFLVNCLLINILNIDIYLFYGIIERCLPYNLLNIFLKCNFFYHIFIYLYLFIFGCVGSPLLLARAFSSCGERGLLFVAVPGLFVAVASLIVEHGL